MEDIIKDLEELQNRMEERAKSFDVGICYPYDVMRDCAKRLDELIVKIKNVRE